MIEGPGPLVMDSDGERYHLVCWCRRMDLRFREDRDAAPKRRAKLPRRKTDEPPKRG